MLYRNKQYRVVKSSYIYAGAVLLRILLMVVPVRAHGDECRTTLSVWHQSIERIAAGEVRRGFRMLDSLRRFAPCFSDSMSAGYTAVVAGTFLPGAPHGEGDAPVALSEDTLTNDGYLADEDIGVSEELQLTIIDAAEKPGAMPSFAFDRLFMIRDRFMVWLPSLQPYQHPTTAGLLRYDSCRVLPGEPLLYHPAKPPWKVQLKIVVDCSESPESIYEYVGDLVISRYDYIRAGNEPLIKDAVALRCYTQQVFHNRQGEFLGLVAFDRYGRFRKRGDAPGTKGTDRLRVRYLIMVKANRAVEEKAQLLLHRTVEPFRHR